MKILMTGFEPFGGETVNPSLQAVERMTLNRPDVLLVKGRLPVVFGEALMVLENLVSEHLPDVVICVGQAGGRTQMTVERIGINVDDARIEDNAGYAPDRKSVV